MTTIRIDGMKCQHCAKATQKALEELGATGVSIDLSKGEASYEGVVEKEVIRRTIAEKGFALLD